MRRDVPRRTIARGGAGNLDPVGNLYLGKIRTTDEWQDTADQVDISREAASEGLEQLAGDEAFWEKEPVGLGESE